MRISSSIFLFCFILLISVQSIYAQKPPAGYMGKRLIAGASISYSPDFSGLFSEGYRVNYQGNADFYVLNAPRMGASLGCVISDFRTIQLDMEFQKMGVSNLNMTDYSYGTNNVIPYNYSRASTVHLRLRFLESENHCSPIGSYGGPALIFVMMNLEGVDSKGQTKGLGSVNDFGIGYQGGFRRVFGDRLLLDLGLEYSLMFKPISYIFKDPNPYGTGQELMEYTQMKAIYKNFYNNMLTCRFGAYILL